MNAKQIEKEAEWKLTGLPVVERAKAEILADIAKGIVPASVKTFAQLHDFVDANGYGGAFEGEFDGSDAGLNFWNRVQDEVDLWLKCGRLAVDLKEENWIPDFARLCVKPGHREACQRAFARANTDPLFREWWKSVKDEYSHITPTDGTGMDRYFIVYVDYFTPLDAAHSLGWVADGRQVFGRHRYKNPKSAVTLMMADRRAFVVGTPE